jgi:hypothetical protein
MNIHRLFAAAALCALATAADARLYVDQESAYGKETFSVGGMPNRVIAQTVTAGLTGELMRVEVGVGCESGELIVEIVNLDALGRIGMAVRSRTVIDAATIPMPPEPRTFDTERPLSMTTGHRFAIILRNETGTCHALKSNAFDAYVPGHGFFRRDPASIPYGWLQFLDFGDQDDLGFRTIVNVPVSTPPCFVNGFGTPFPGDLPVCRCIRDEGLRDFRCALMHPDFFLFRNLPDDLPPGKPFKVKWTLVVFAPMDGVVELLEHYPPGFANVPKTPLTFFVGQVPVGASITLEYEAIAPVKGGRYKVESEVLGEGRMGTVLEIP